MMYYHDGFLWSFVFEGIFTLLFWAFAIAGIVWVVRNFSRNGKFSTLGSSNTALDILKERYAKGEIGKEEFDAKKKDLSE